MIGSIIGAVQMRGRQQLEQRGSNMDTLLIEPQRPLALDAKMIRRLRKRAGLTQAALADAVGVTARSVRYWEAGGRKPQDPEVVRRMVEVLAPEKLADGPQRVLWAHDGTPVVLRASA